MSFSKWLRDWKCLNLKYLYEILNNPFKDKSDLIEVMVSCLISWQLNYITIKIYLYFIKKSYIVYLDFIKKKLSQTWPRCVINRIMQNNIFNRNYVFISVFCKKKKKRKKSLIPILARADVSSIQKITKWNINQYKCIINKRNDNKIKYHLIKICQQGAVY